MLHIICALKHEARLIIERYQLVHDGAALTFTTYSNKDKGISLTVTGVGKQAAAEGTQFAADFHEAREHDAWLNIGIAGHRNQPIGKPLLASRVTEAQERQIWYPQLSFPTSLDTLPLTTLAQPAAAYLEHDMMDMEAAGFFRSACRHAPLDLIHSLKIISDNEEHPSEKISKQSVLDLFNANLAEIDKLVTQLRLCSKASSAT